MVTLTDTYGACFQAVEVCPKGKSGATFISEAPVLTPPSKSDSAPSSVAPSPAPKSSASMSSKVLPFVLVICVASAAGASLKAR